LILAVVVTGIYSVVGSGLIPVNADTVPGWLETWLARTSLDAALLHEVARAQNPLALTDQNLIQGIHLYAQYCVVCHGSEMGVAALSPIAKGLYQKPPQFATNGVEDDPEDVTFWIIKHGIRLTGMPAFGDSLSDRQIWAIALFLTAYERTAALGTADLAACPELVAPVLEPGEPEIAGRRPQPKWRIASREYVNCYGISFYTAGLAYGSSEKLFVSQDILRDGLPGCDQPPGRLQ